MLDKIKKGIIVSCQAQHDEPLYSSFIMSKMALAAKEGGAVGIRANTTVDIEAIKKEVDLPIIGLIKQDYDDSEIYITPTKKEVLSLIDVGCDMIAIDATNRKRPNNEKLEDLLKLVHENNILAMADISTFEEGVKAELLGFDCVSTTLSGYTSHSKQSNKPNFKLMKKLSKTLKIPVIGEGKIETVSHAKKALKYGLHALVIGSIITRPQVITKKFVKGVE